MSDHTAEAAARYTSDSSSSEPPSYLLGFGPLRVDTLDKRTTNYKRAVAIRDHWAETRAAIISDHGGEENIAAIKLKLIKAFTTLALRLDLQQDTMLAGGEIDEELFGKNTDRLRRLGETLGLERIARNVPTLQEYLASLKTTPIDEPVIDAQEVESS